MKTESGLWLIEFLFFFATNGTNLPDGKGRFSQLAPLFRIGVKVIALF
jgi:hypothetical protein